MSRTAKKAVKKAVQKKATARKAAKSNPILDGLATTIRLIEREGPCLFEYIQFLKDFGGEPIDKETYSEWKRKNKGKSTLGPDTPIPLFSILALKSRCGMTGLQRVLWIIGHGCVLGDHDSQAINRLASRLDDVEDLPIRVLLAADRATIDRILA